MLEEKAVEKIADLGRQASSVELHDLKAMGCPNSFLIKQGDTFDLREKPPRHKVDKVQSLNGLIAASGRWKAATVWHEGTSIVALHDDERRQDSTSFLLQYAKTFQTIQSLDGENPAFVTQKQMVRLLTHDLADALEPTLGLLNAIRQLSFQRKSDGGSTIEHGKESLGREVEDEVQGRTDIPERFVLLSPVFLLANSPVLPIRMGLEINVETCQLAIRPLPDEIVKAERETHDWIHTELVAAVADETEVFYGSPGSP